MDPQKPTALQQDQQQQRPTSAASAAAVPLPLADRIALYCRQTSAANNAGVMRNVSKPSASEMLGFLHQQQQQQQDDSDVKDYSVYSDTSLLRVLLTDSDYDAVCRDVLCLDDAIEWLSAQKSHHSISHSSSASCLEMLLQSVHVFTQKEIETARQVAVERGLDSVLLLSHRGIPAKDVEATTEVDCDVERKQEMPQHSEEYVVDEPEVCDTVDNDEAMWSSDREAINLSKEREEAELFAQGIKSLNETLMPQPNHDDCEDHSVVVETLVVGALSQHVTESETAIPTAAELPRPEDQDGRQEAREEIENKEQSERETTPDMEAEEQCDTGKEDDSTEEHAESTSQQDDTKYVVESAGAAETITIVAPLHDEKPQHELVATEQSLPREQESMAVSASHGSITSGDGAEDPMLGTPLSERQAVEAPNGSTASIEEQTAPPPTAKQLEPALDDHGADQAPIHVPVSRAAHLTHSASTVERIVRVVDKEIANDGGDESDSIVERAIGHDATILERRYSFIPESDVASSSSPRETAATPELLPKTEEIHSKEISVLEQIRDIQEPLPNEPVRQDHDTKSYDAQELLSVVPASETMAIVSEPVDMDTGVDPHQAHQEPLRVEASLLLEESTAINFHVGDAVEVRYRGWHRYFPGEIAAVVQGGDAGDGTHPSVLYEVRYADGDYEVNVPTEWIRCIAGKKLPVSVAVPAAEELQAEHSVTIITSTSRYAVGDLVEALYRRRSRWYPGTITQVDEGSDATTYDIAYDDGDAEQSVMDHHVRRRPDSAASNGIASDSASTTALLESAATVMDCDPGIPMEKEQAEDHESSAVPSPTISTATVSGMGEQRSSEDMRSLRIGDRVRVDHQSHSAECGWIVGVRWKKSEDDCDVYDVLYDAVGDSEPPQKDVGVARNRIHRLETHQTNHGIFNSRADQLPVGIGATQADATKTREPQDPEDGESTKTIGPLGNQMLNDEPSVVETPVLPFQDDDKPVETDLPPLLLEANRLLIQSNDDDDGENENEINGNVASDLSDDDLDVDSVLESTTQFTPAITTTIATATTAATTTATSTSTSSGDDARVHKPTRATSASRVAKPRLPMSVRKLKSERQLHQEPVLQVQQPQQPPQKQPVLSEATLRYLTPQPRKSTERPRTGRSHHHHHTAASTATKMTTMTPRSRPPAATAAVTATHRSPGRKAKREPSSQAVDVSWKDLEEWKNVDLILNRKRRIVVSHGQMQGSDVPWGEEFAAIQSLKRFASQYPDVLQQHIEHQLQDVVDSASSSASGLTARAMSATTTSAARDALLLVKDLAFLLRHRLSPFFDTILPVVLPAVFHSQKRFLCDTAYQVLEALVAHCSGRKLVVALLKQALRFPREDMRLVNLTCLYIEKCLTSLSFTAVHELLTRSATSVLEAIADLLGCKSAACQSSLQKSLLLLTHAVGEEVMERLLDDHLMGNALAMVRKHLALAESAGANKSPQGSPKKQLQTTPGKHAATAAAAAMAAAAAATTASGSPSILQRMLMQRQNRVVPAPK